MPKPRFAIIVDRSQLQEWQCRALQASLDLIEIPLVLNCTNTRTQRRWIKWLFYYVLNLISIRRGLGKFAPFSLDCKQWLNFESTYQGLWQRLPPDVVDVVYKSNIDGILKFGMGLLADPEDLDLKYGVLSFHHGNPEKYRGRPAGFYELRHNRPSIGIIIQRISNKLDGGEVMAIAHARIYDYSYFKTLQNAYAISEQVLLRGLRNSFDRKSENIKSTGDLYTLPSNAQVLGFIGQLLFRKIRRLLYGALYFKRWNICKTSLDTDVKAFFTESRKAGVAWLGLGKTAILSKSSTGYADPFVDFGTKKIFIEEIKRSNNIGRIKCLDLDTFEHIPMPDLGMDGHVSYPFFFQNQRGRFLLPEVASWSAPILLNMTDCGVRRSSLSGFKDWRLVDTTYLEWRSRHYIFGGFAGSSADALYLFSSEELTGPYSPHPQNPIVMDVSCSRMGGPILNLGGMLLRFGQDNSRQYGDGLHCCAITQLSMSEYEEEKCFRINVRNKSGPHTVNFVGNEVIFDFYDTDLSILAGVRRMKNHFARAKTKR